MRAKNSETTFYNNYFESSVASEIALSGTSDDPAEVAENQGSFSAPAENCFENVNSAILAVPATSIPFDYYVFEFAEDCKRPTNNLTDGGLHNYEIQNSDKEVDRCSEKEETPAFTLTDYNNAKSDMNAAKTALESDPENEALKDLYEEAKDVKNRIFDYLAEVYIKNENFTDLESLLWQDGEKEKKRWAVGLRMQREDVLGAEALLNLIPNDGQEDEWFEEIMHINFQCEPSGFDCELSYEQEAKLHEIASSASPLNGYACALLHVLTGFDCEGYVEETESREAGVSTQTQNFVKIKPNPASDWIEVSLDGIHAFPVQWNMFNVHGTLVKSGTLIDRAAKRITTTDLMDGAYYIRFQATERRPFTERFIIQH